MKNSMRQLALSILVILSCTGIAGSATDADHPLVKRFQGSEVLFQKKSDFDELRLALGKIEWDGAQAKVKPYLSKSVEGRLTKTYYASPAGPSVLEVFRNYENELKADGFEMLFSARGADLETPSYNNQIAREIFRITQPYGSPEQSADWMLAVCDDNEAAYVAARKTREDGGETFASVYVFANPSVADNFFERAAAGRVVVRVDVCDVQPMEQRMTLVKASEMDNRIGSEGRVVLYGIPFDFNKAEIKPEASPTLEQIAALLGEKPTLKLLVVGHTDNVGGFEFNRDLSQRRAKAVVEALVSRFRLSPERLFPFGVSYASPIATNETEEGRTNNRRVELVEFKQ